MKKDPFSVVQGSVAFVLLKFEGDEGLLVAESMNCTGDGIVIEAVGIPVEESLSRLVGESV